MVQSRILGTLHGTTATVRVAPDAGAVAPNIQVGSSRGLGMIFNEAKSAYTDAVGTKPFGSIWNMAES